MPTPKFRGYVLIGDLYAAQPLILWHMLGAREPRTYWEHSEKRKLDIGHHQLHSNYIQETWSNHDCR